MPPLPRGGSQAKNLKLAAAVVVGFAGLGLGPVAWMFLSPHAKVDGSKGLPKQASQRGAYFNTGSIDVGPDQPLNQLGGGGDKQS